MEQNVFLTVIIPVYNAQSYLEPCVRSVLGGKDRGVEVLLVDDGSTDGSGGLCDHLAEEEQTIRVFHQDNRGPGGARNTGLVQAKGEYVLFVDSDDALCPGAMDWILDTLESQKPDILTFDYLADDGKGHLTLTKANHAPVGQAFRLEEHPGFLRSMPATWARVWRKRLFLDNQIRYPDRIFFGEDLQTSCKLFALASSIVYLPEPVYRYYDRPGSLMHGGDPERNRGMIQAMGNLTDWYEAQGLRQKYEQQLCAMVVEHLLLATSVRVAKVAPEAPVLEEIQTFAWERYPAWREVAGQMSLSWMRKIALGLVQGRHYRLLGWLFRLKEGQA